MTKTNNGSASVVGKRVVLKNMPKTVSKSNEPGAATLRYKGSKHFRQR